MAEKDNIQFILVTSNESTETPLATCSTSSESATDSELPNARVLPVIDLLSNLVDKEVAEKAVLESRLIEEQQLEVLNLSISYDQLLLLISMARKYFDLDAWVTLGKNLCSFLSQDQDKGIVVPCYTDETPDEPYWLFYIPNKSISFLLSLTPKKVIRGYWMDVSKNGGDYVLLHEHLHTISGQNIIVCNNGIPLYIQLALSIETGVSLSLPKGFHNAVLSAIRSHGHTHV